MNGSLRAGTLFGIPFYIHPSWFLVLSFVTLSYSTGLAEVFPELGNGWPWILGFGTALLLFTSVVAHELGHSWVAIQQGVEVKSITLFFFGGLASLDREARTPAGSFWIAIAGPAVSFILFGMFKALSVAGSSGPITAVIGLIASINLALALFNLIPGLPLDGGNILKAALWKMTGNPYKGVVLAARVGQALGGLAIAFAVIPLFVAGSFGNLWYGLIGWFLWQNAGRMAQSATLQDKLAKFTVADVMIEDSVVTDDLTLRQLANLHITKGSKYRQYWVTNSEGHWSGILEMDDLKLISTDLWPHVQVKELMQPVTEIATVGSNDSLLDGLSLLNQKQLSTLAVVSSTDTLIGRLERADIGQILYEQEDQ